MLNTYYSAIDQGHFEVIRLEDLNAQVEKDFQELSQEYRELTVTKQEKKIASTAIQSKSKGKETKPNNNRKLIEVFSKWVILLVFLVFTNIITTNLARYTSPTIDELTGLIFGEGGNQFGVLTLAVGFLVFSLIFTGLSYISPQLRRILNIIYGED